MSLVKNAPRTATTIVVRSDANARISHSRDPYYNLMRRIFQEDATTVRGQKFLSMVEERQAAGNAIKKQRVQAFRPVLKRPYRYGSLVVDRYPQPVRRKPVIR